VQLRIADDGAGFDPAQLPHAGNGHFGWRGIRERAAQIGALVELKSQPGRGTSVTVVVLTEK
jgi:signal transduction histidine kinase